MDSKNQNERKETHAEKVLLEPVTIYNNTFTRSNEVVFFHSVHLSSETLDEPLVQTD